MSYDVYLMDPVTKKTVEFTFKHDMKGGTFCAGGSNTAELNVTYNYSTILHRVLPPNGIRSLYGKTGAESILLLKKAIDSLKDDVNPDYWTPTEGNVKQALNYLLAFASMRPDGIWNGD